MTEALRLGLVGFGRLAREYYVPALRRLPDATVVGVADPLAASRHAAAARLPSAATCATPDELLRLGVDALLVATPPSTHLGIWNAAQAARLPVFMEKPFVLPGERAVAERAPGRGLMVNFNRRFWPAYRRLRALLGAGRIGEPAALDLALHVDLLPWCTVTRHRLSPVEGGVLVDLGSQALDLVAWLAGAPPQELVAEVATERWPNDHVRLRLRFATGLVASCDLAYEERTFERIAVTGAGGRLRLHDPNMAIHFERAGGPRRGRARDLLVFGYRAVRRSRSMARYSIAAALRGFVDGCRSGRPFAPGWAEATRTVRWLEAAVESAAAGRSVALDAAA